MITRNDEEVCGESSWDLLVDVEKKCKMHRQEFPTVSRAHQSSRKGTTTEYTVDS